MIRSSLKWFKVTLSAAAALLLVVCALAWLRLWLALPPLTGQRTAEGIRSEVSIQRDRGGVPTLQAGSPDDVAFGLGYVHAQDRFFQMDLSRRRAAGELAELLGPGALRSDQSARIHEFRSRAQNVVERLTGNQQKLVRAYTAGVNAGLASLRASPWEYAVLRTKPKLWTPEDAILCIFSLSFELQDSNGAYEYSIWAVRQRLGDQAFGLLAPVTSRWDAPIDNRREPGMALRTDYESIARHLKREAKSEPSPRVVSSDWTPPMAFMAGSNSFAVSGAHSSTGLPLIGGDMHLGLAVPNTWYRARLQWANPSRGEVVGVTLPGIPAVISGSNGHVAWRFTNAHVDTVDLVLVSQDPANPSRYLAGENTYKNYETRTATIQVRGQAPVTLTTVWTEWGPVLDAIDPTTKLAIKWTIDDAKAIDLNLIDLESAESVEQALAIAKTAGTPALNLLVVDSQGSLGWTIAGKLPRRAGFDGRTPRNWGREAIGWTGFVAPEDYPQVLNPPGGRLWTANNRLVGGDALAVLGDGRYDIGARAGQIRDRLATLEHAGPTDFLAVQLDDEAKFLMQWRDVLLAVLTQQTCANKRGRADIMQAVEHWNGRADAGSTGYYFLREWHEHLVGVVFGDWARACSDSFPRFSAGAVRWEDALWVLVHDKPDCLVGKGCKSWDEMMLRAVDDVVAQVSHTDRDFARATWGRHNSSRIAHPFSMSLPGVFAHLIDMPAIEQSGDQNMPRVAGSNFGASDRMVVSPGRESEGIFEMPGGQSGNPASPFYRADYESWCTGTASPLLPKPAQYVLVLKPTLGT